MPEGHTLHRLAREQSALFAGRPVHVTSPQGRFETGAALLDGRVLDEVFSYGKHLFARFGGDHLHVHLEPKEHPMAKALIGYLDSDLRDPRLAADNARLRARVRELEALVLRLSEENDRLVAAQAADILDRESGLQEMQPA